LNAYQLLLPFASPYLKESPDSSSALHRCVCCSLTWQLATMHYTATRSLLPLPCPPVGWGGGMGKRGNLWDEIKTV